MQALGIALAFTGVTLGVGAAVAAIDEHRLGGLGKAAFCSRLTDEHVRTHTEELSRWVQNELSLTPAQAAALTPLTDGIGEWAHELAPVCEMNIADGPSHVAALVQITDASQRAVTKFAVAFNELYGMLDDEQRGIVDAWMSHDHGPLHRHSFHHLHTEPPAT